MRREELPAFLTHESATATALMALVVDLYGAQALNWEPETLRQELASDIGEPSDGNMDKLSALITALTTDLFYTDVDAFTHICNALAGAGIDLEQYDPATIREAALTVAEVLLNEGTESLGDLGTLFSDDVKGYIQARAAYERVGSLPKILSFVQETESAADPQTAAMDPTIYAAAWEEDEAEEQELNRKVADRVNLILRQLDGLPLRGRDPEAWSSFYTQPQG